MTGGRPRPVLRVDKKTGEVLERFETIYRAQDTERGVLSVRDQCEGKTLGKHRRCYRYEEGFDPSEDWKGKKGRPVWIFDRETGRIGWVVNAAEAAKALDVSRDNVLDAIRSGNVLWGRFTLRHQRRLDEWSLLKERMEHEVPKG